MKKFASIISHYHKIILLIGIILLIPAAYGYLNTKVNYDILVYLPDDIDTIKGQEILTEDFGLGAYAFIMTDLDNKDVLTLEKRIKKIDGVNQVASVADVIGTTIPKEMLPEKVLEKLYHDDTSIILVTFEESTSKDSTVEAVEKLRKLVDPNSISSMTSMVLDTRNLSAKEFFAYVAIAVLLCLFILTISTDSYLIPYLLLGNIGMAVLYNMGTNIFLGKISYITQSITAVLQLGVTTDFSIFLYHQFQEEKLKTNDKLEAMKKALHKTFQSVIGSSLTTFVGFLSLCTMDLTLGTDIGVVMAKGVFFGLVSVFTVFPAMLLTFDKYIDKTKHKVLLPEFKALQKFSLKYYKIIFILFLLLLIPAYIGNKSYDVYYKLDDSLPSDLPFHVSNSRLAEEFHITSPEMILIHNDVSKSETKLLVKELEKVEGIDLVLAPSTLGDAAINSLLPSDLKELANNDKYQLIIINSEYEIASDEINAQIKEINKIIKKYDSKAFLAGEGPLMNDLVSIADHDFHMVNYTSIIVIFLVMVIVLKSFGLPLILIFTIEFAIFTNMAVAYYTGTSLPFVASIVVGTIQLGATIDYAILMSTTYLRQRREKKREKQEAMQATLSIAVPSIIISALCFFGATIGVSLYTKIDMIGSICNLLSRGSLISMLVVVLVLPALLIIFDSFILKTTKSLKEEK